MEREVQLSAVVAPSVKERLEKHARATGVKKGYLIEQALLHHLSALESLPADVIVPALLVVTRKSGEEIVKRMTRPAQPTPALRTLMRADPKNGD